MERVHDIKSNHVLIWNFLIESIGLSERVLMVMVTRTEPRGARSRLLALGGDNPLLYHGAHHASWGPSIMVTRYQLVTMLHAAHLPNTNPDLFYSIECKFLSFVRFTLGIHNYINKFSCLWQLTGHKYDYANLSTVFVRVELMRVCQNSYKYWLWCMASVLCAV